MVLSELENTFEKLLAAAPEVKPPPPPNFFEVSGFPHYETVISNWYAFFFDPEAEHGLGDLFLAALVELINEKRPNAISMDTCSVSTEVTTKKGNAIDLVLAEKDPEGDLNNAIIIENKIKAALYNDLKDYYDSIEAKYQKVGVVLALREEDLSRHKNFVAITHFDLLNQVKEQLGQYWTGANEKYLGILKDFIQNLESFSTPTENMENIRFYFENAEQIEKLFALKEEGKNYILQELRKIEPDLKWNWFRTNTGSVTLVQEDKGFYLYFGYTKIFTEKKFTLDFWLKGEEVIRKWKDIYAQFDPTPHVEKGFSYIGRKSSKEWARIGILTHNLPSDFSSVKDIGQIVKDAIVQRMDPIVQEMQKVLDKV